MTLFQKLMKFILKRLQQLNFLQCRENCYEPKLTSDGLFTGYYTQVKSIEEFICDETSPTQNQKQWLNRLVCNSGERKAVEELCRTKYLKFPVLMKNRSVFSFQNVQLNTCTMLFELYSNIHHKLVSANYFNYVVPERVLQSPDLGRFLPTPHLDKIFLTQEHDNSKMGCIYAMTGELLHQKGEHDNYQHVLFIKGIANTEKSRFMNLMTLPPFKQIIMLSLDLKGQIRNT